MMLRGWAFFYNGEEGWFSTTSFRGLCYLNCTYLELAFSVKLEKGMLLERGSVFKKIHSEIVSSLQLIPFLENANALLVS